MTWLEGFVFDLHDSKFHLCPSVSGSIKKAQKRFQLRGLLEKADAMLLIKLILLEYLKIQIGVCKR